MEFHFFNKYHYGDNIINLKFLNSLSNILEDNNITIKYYYNNNYITNVYELNNYIKTDRIILDVLENKPKESIELWMGTDILDINCYKFDIYIDLFYKKILNIMRIDNFNNTINTSLYQNEDYLLDIYSNLDSKYKDIDILVLNSIPNSGQYILDKEKWDNMCIKLSKKYNIVTSSYVNDSIKCTSNDNLSIQEIGAISTHSKFIIGIHSGPMTGCYNIHTQKYVKYWFIFVNTLQHFNINSFDNVDIESIHIFFNI